MGLFSYASSHVLREAGKKADAFLDSIRDGDSWKPCAWPDTLKRLNELSVVAGKGDVPAFCEYVGIFNVGAYFVYSAEDPRKARLLFAVVKRDLEKCVAAQSGLVPLAECAFLVEESLAVMQAQMAAAHIVAMLSSTYPDLR